MSIAILPLQLIGLLLLHQTTPVSFKATAYEYFNKMIVLLALRSTLLLQEAGEMDYTDLFKTPPTVAAFTPICALCKKVRNADGSWSYFPSHTYEHVTHVFCEGCADMILAS